MENKIKKVKEIIKENVGYIFFEEDIYCHNITIDDNNNVCYEVNFSSWDYYYVELTIHFKFVESDEKQTLINFYHGFCEAKENFDVKKFIETGDNDFSISKLAIVQILMYDDLFKEQ